MNSTNACSQTPATFVIERDIPAGIAQVWAAFADQDAKKRWFGVDSDGWVVDEYTNDFRVGGHDVNAGTFNGDTKSRFAATYTDIVDRERFVLTYDMWFNDDHISTSIQTVSLEKTDSGTRLTLTEQGVYLDGLDTPEQREEGTGHLLDALDASLTT